MFLDTLWINSKNSNNLDKLKIKSMSQISFSTKNNSHLCGVYCCVSSELKIAANYRYNLQMSAHYQSTNWSKHWNCLCLAKKWKCLLISIIMKLKHFQIQWKRLELATSFWNVIQCLHRIIDVDGQTVYRFSIRFQPHFDHAHNHNR